LRARQPGARLTRHVRQHLQQYIHPLMQVGDVALVIGEKLAVRGEFGGFAFQDRLVVAPEQQVAVGRERAGAREGDDQDQNLSLPSDSELFDEAADGSLMSCDAKTPGRKRDPSSRRTLRGRASREGIEQRQSGLSCSAWCFCASPGSRCHRHRPLATLGAIRAQTQSRLNQATVAGAS
jgi:hypothetical protein